MRLFLPLLLLLSLLSGAYAQQKSGNVSFTAPKGWDSSSIEGGLQYTHRTGGQIDAVIMVGQDMPVPSDPAGWVEDKALSLLKDDPIREQQVLSEKLANGLQSTYKVLVGGTEQQPLMYVVLLLHNSTTAVQMVLLTTDMTRTEALAKEMDVVALSVKFTGKPVASTGSPAASAGSTAGNPLPQVKAMNAAQFKAAGGNPERQFIPDEFRCYVEMEGTGLTPELVVQMLPGGKYRTVYGNGSIKVNQDGSLRKLLFTGGPLDEADGYLNFDDYGQDFSLNDVGDKGLDFQCYQRGPRENLALFEFKLKTPREGKYACTLSDGKGTSGGTLELLAGNTYRLGGQTGRFSVDYRADQDHDYSSLDFVGGPLDNRLGSYSEDEHGLREVSFTRPSMECRVLVKPTPFPSRYGSAKAPAPPRGSGGLTGNWVHSRAGQLLPGLQLGPDMTSSMVLNSECPGNVCWEYAFFNKNGYVFTQEPDLALQETDCSRTLANGLPLCEVYRIQNGKIQIGDDPFVPFKQQGNTLTLGTHEYDKLLPLDSLKPTGEFKSTVVTNAVLAIGGTISNASMFFTAQGQFAFDRSSSTGLSGTGYVASVVSKAVNRGTYQFKGNTLELKYADGRLIRMFAATTLTGGKPDLSMLRLGGSTYILQKPGQK